MHDFKRFPELTNNQMQLYYFDSPHKQITENFTAKVVSVHDGDTIRVETSFRDFNFPIRLAELAAPELDERGGTESQKWLEQRINGKEVYVILSKQRVEKWGRLLAKIMYDGVITGEESIMQGHATSWKDKERIKWY